MIPCLQLGGLGRRRAAAAGGGGGGATTTINPADKHANITLSNGNLTATSGTAAWKSARSTTSRNTGKKYFEVRHDVSGGNAGALFGLMVAGDSLSQHMGHTSQSANDCGFMYDYSPNSYKFQNSTVGAVISGYGFCATGQFSHCAVDFDAGKVWFRNSSGAGWAGGGDPAAGTSPTLTFTAGTTMFAALSLYFNTHAVTFNFGQGAFNGAVPSGFSAWG